MLLVAAVAGIVLYTSAQVGAGSGFPFPCLQNEELYYHVHPYLRIVIDGQNVTIPTAVGIENPVIEQGLASGGLNSCFEPLHTHDDSGILHIESNTNTTYTLGDFFEVWSATYHTVSIDGVAHPIVFNQTDILGFKADGSHQVVLLVNGKPSNAYGALSLVQLDYCNSANAQAPPCYPTAPGGPQYGSGGYPYPTGNTIVIEYSSST